MSHFLSLRDGRRLSRTCKQFHLISKSPQSGIIVMDDILSKRWNRDGDKGKDVSMLQMYRKISLE
jgi:hypothetical protein